jgi:DNA-binding CsgD family transcriptional regulator/tetratricopeptide (TPR) repeat protein
LTTLAHCAEAVAELMIEPMASRVSSPVLIGRGADLARLRAAFGRAEDGRSSATLIAGEAGVGKTRLVGSFVDLARAEGGVVLMGGCIPLGDGALPYAPVIEALRGFARRVGPDDVERVFGHGRSELARLVPDLGPVTDGSGSPSGLSIGSAQGRLFELLLGVLERLAAEAPLAFIVEDLHWSDQSTRDLLGFLVRNLRDVPVMLVFTYRSDELHRRHPLLPFLAELERTGRVERIELAPFGRRDATDQLAAIAGRDLDARLVESIHARSGGNAFFAEELLAAAGDDGRTELPSTLRDVLLARVATLADATQEFLRVASAAGPRVEPALIAAAVAMDERALYEALRESVGRQVLVPDPTAGVERYAFRHALLQEAVYDDLLPGERTRLHSAFARTLEATASDGNRHAAELAYHWYAAHDLPRALEAAVRAGAAAEAGYAFPEAVAQYERAVELWDQVPDAEARAGFDRVDLLATLAGVSRFHEPARAVSHIEAAIRMVDEDSDPIRAGLLNERLGRYAWIAGQGDCSQDAYRAAMALIPQEPPTEARARALAGLSQILMLAGWFEESSVLANESLALAGAVAAAEIEGHALNTRGVDKAILGDLDGGFEDLSASLAIAEKLGVVDDIGRAYANWVWVLEAAGRLEEAIALAWVGVDSANALGSMRFFGSHILCNAGDDLYRLGRWDESERALRRAEEVNPLGINAILVEELLGRLAMARGLFDEAQERLAPLAQAAERAADIQFIIPVHASLAELALWQGKPDEAVAHVMAAIRLIEFSPEVRIGEAYAIGLRANADAADLARARRSPDQARSAVEAGDRLLEAIRARHADVLRQRPAYAALSAAWLVLSEAEATRLHHRPDPETWGVAVRSWDDLERPYVVAYARWREAEALLEARGSRDLAGDALRASLETATRLGAVPLAREVTALAARARIALDASPAPGPAEAGTLDDPAVAALRLTAREREVLGLVALGRTNRQIADELFISENTAGVHVSNIIGKLGVTGRGEAAAVAYRLGLAGAVAG